MGGDDDCSRRASQRVRELVHEERGEVVGGLVEDEEVWAFSQPHGQVQPALLALRHTTHGGPQGSGVQ